MIITCPACLTKFNLAEEKIPEGGAKARCSKCHHIFFISRSSSWKPGSPPGEAAEALPGVSVKPEKKVEGVPAPRARVVQISLKIVLAALILGGATYGLWQISEREWVKERGRYYYAAFKSFLGFKKNAQGFIALEKIRGYYLENKFLNRIFVVEGEAVNRWNEPRSFIKVKGTLLDARGEKIEERSSYCGNILLEEDLKKFPPEAIEKSLGAQFGETFSNVNIPPGKAVPFMIVFMDFSKVQRPEKKVTDFQVEVVSSQRGT